MESEEFFFYYLLNYQLIKLLTEVRRGEIMEIKIKNKKKLVTIMIIINENENESMHLNNIYKYILA